MMSCTTVTRSFTCSPLDDMPSSHPHSCVSVLGRVLSAPNNQKFCSQESLSELVMEKNAKNLKAVSEFVQKHYGELIGFMNSYLYLCDLNGTIYMGQTYLKEGWEESYLPEITRMEVLGTLEVDCVDISPCPSEQWVILVGEDGYVYAYWNEELKLIAKSLREFVKYGKKKVYASYLYSECSDEDDESAKPSEEIQKIRQRTKDFVNNNADEFRKFLAKIKSLKQT
ncbi:uncharacterized protein LOC121005899 isoform X2 [Bufo bufo]|uniref:uncharacterized protein LOC121005899 isoform X2 n=1 Tax=Bufo bufo TaxID=8384 RepID=UPI001ABE0193|nr:uncharacterized protein LOC121005899 isoform X2 [Bufo bufo]